MLGLLALVAAGCGGKSAPGTTTSAAPARPWPETTPRVELGYVRSLTPLGRGYKLRLDLHLRFGVDRTGLAACIDNHDCAPGTSGFPDDSYDRDLHYVVTYYVPPAAPVELVSLSGQPAATVTAHYLYGLAHGRDPRHVDPMARGADALREFAFYVQVSPSFSAGHYESVTRLYQLFHP